jgi:MFS family permease
MKALRSTKALPRSYRWIVLVIMSLICLAQYYIYDSVTPLGTRIKEELTFSSSDYGLLFSYYSVGNVFFFLLIFAGMLVDTLGLKFSGILYGFLCFFGAALTALGAWPGLPELLGSAYEWIHTAFFPTTSTELKVMLLGRLIYGVGAEAILVVNNKILARWFKGKELALAYGLNLSIMRVGTFAAMNLQSPAAEWLGLSGSLWLAAYVMGAGFGSFFLYIALERSARGTAGAPPDEADEAASRSTSEGEKFVLRDAFSFDASFWLICLLCVAFYSAVFPFQSYAPDILVQKFGYDSSTASHYASALVLGTMVFTPIFGWIVDRHGKRATLMMLGSLLLIPAHFLLGYTMLHPIVPIFVVGVALSLVPAALWAAIPMMVPERRLGTAFGVIGYVQNVGLLLFPYIAGKIADAHTITQLVDGKEVPVVDYTSTMLLFVALGGMGLVFAVLLKWVDLRAPKGRSIEGVLAR